MRTCFTSVIAFYVQATPHPNPMNKPAVLVAEVDAWQQQQQQQQHDDVHLELLCLLQLPRREFPGSYSIAAIAVSDCGEWWSSNFIVQNDLDESFR